MEESVKKGIHIVQYPRDVSLCAGCGGCESVCSLLHEGCVGHNTSRIFVDRGTVDMMHTVYTCQQCECHPCYDACPLPGKAMCIDENGVVYIVPDGCIGCKKCIKACIFEPKRINFNPKTKKALKCDLCRGRVGGPACVEDCQVSCIGLSSQPVPPSVTEVAPPVPPIK